MAGITPKTELAAVNLILRNMAEAPVNSLSGDIPLEASQARDTLVEVSEDVQLPGWFFNREKFTFAPDQDGEIKLPRNTLSVKSTGYSDGIPLYVRRGKLYDMTPFASSFKFTDPVQVELILGLDFEDLPASARRYIALRAARVYQAREQGDRLGLEEDTQDETRAYNDLIAEQLRTEPVSLKSSPAVLRIAESGGYAPIN